ncbi:RNA-splicing ligase RtcB [Diplonema papillatum]|nr:RNA-splicing ligase RtcB [Diplonema papillatum]
MLRRTLAARADVAMKVDVTRIGQPRWRSLRDEHSKVDIKAWVDGVTMDSECLEQLRACAQLPVVFKHIAVMPDVHYGKAATVGTVIPTIGAIIPAAVGVDIGCGMIAAETTLRADDLPDSLREMRTHIEMLVPHGRTHNGQKGLDAGGWRGNPPERVKQVWKNELKPGFDKLVARYPRLAFTNNDNHLGTLGTGNHFLEVHLDEKDAVWLMLHSGSRGVGNAIGFSFIELAKQDMGRHLANLPDQDLAYIKEGSNYFNDYMEAVLWAQNYARLNRMLMMESMINALRKTKGIPPFKAVGKAVNCHHNYVQNEHHFGQDVWVTRKGAVRAFADELGIIPGSMGTDCYIVRGKGNPESFCSCSHGAGREMSRVQARRTFSIQEHTAATEGIECRKDKDVLDETPMAYKPIAAVMDAQSDLIEIVARLKQIVCVKG